MNILTLDFKSPEVPKQLLTSFKETGFSVLTNHSISDELMDRVYEEWQKFFTKDKAFNLQEATGH